MKKTFLLLGLLLTCLLNAQDISLAWADLQSNGSYDYGYTSARDASGNVYTTGLFFGTVDFDPGPGTYTLLATGTSGLNDMFITKLDAAGNFVWAKQIRGASSEIGQGIALDPSGNIFLTGYFFGHPDFDPDPTNTYTLSHTNGRVFVLKLDNSGNFLWANNFLISSVTDCYGNSIACDASGNAYVSGYNLSAGAQDYDPGAGTYTLQGGGVFISKFDGMGNFVWAGAIPGSVNAVGISIAADASGNIYATGTFSGTADFDFSAATYNLSSANNSNDIFVLKVDASGNFVWAQSLGGTSDDNGNSVASDAAGDVYLTGSFQGTSDFDPGMSSSNLTSAGMSDIFVCKLTAAGTLSWAKALGGASDDMGNSISVNSTYVHTTGAFQSTADFDPDAGVSNYTAAGLEDVFISALDVASGNFVYAKTFGGTSSDIGRTIIADASGNLYNAGVFNGNVDFDPNQGVDNLNGPGSLNIYVSKFAVCSSVPANAVNTTNAANQSICEGQTATLSASAVSAAVIWYASSSSPTVLTSGTVLILPNLTAGTYTYYAAGSTCSLSAGLTAVTLTVHASPTITANNGDACEGSSYTITASGATTYSYSGGTAVITPTATENYTVTGTDANGCSGSTVITIGTIPNPSVTVVTSNPVIACVLQPVNLTAQGAVTYSWSASTNTISSIIVTPSITTVYTVTGTGANGCQATATITQNVIQCDGIKMFSNAEPVLIYPNPGNGELTIELTSDAHVIVLNPIGEIIFNENRQEGKSKIDLLNRSNGVYFIKVTKDKNQQTFKFIKQ